MTTDPLTIRGVNIIRTPGFDSESFTVDDLSEGINIIHGPNAAGKTTVAKSIEWLFWPDTCNGHTRLVGQLSRNGEDWRIELDNGRVQYQCDGQDVNGPTLPPSDQRDRYRLWLHDLLQHETRNESFAKTIARESAGGYDLAAARETLDYHDSPSTRGKNVVQDAEDAVDAWRDARREQEELQQEETRLSRLRNELEEARAAKDRVKLLEQAISYAEARDELTAAQANLEEFPDVLAEVDGDEVSKVQDLKFGIEEWEEKKREAQTTKDEAENQLIEADLPDDGIPIGFLDCLKRLRDRLESLEEDRTSLEQELNGAHEKRANVRTDIPLDVDQETLCDLQPVDWQTVSEFARTADKVNAERAKRTAIESWLQDGSEPSSSPEEEVDRSTLERGSNALENWLAASPPDTATDGTDTFRVALVSSVLLAGAGIALGTLVHPALFATLLAASGILWYGYRARSQQADDSDPRVTHQQSFQQIELAQPESWTPEAVRERLLNIYDALAARKLTEERKQRRDSLLANTTDLDEKQQTLDETREDLRARLGAAPETTDVELTVIMKRVLDWQTVHDEVVRLDEELTTADRQIDTARRTLTTMLSPYGEGDIDGAPMATEAIRKLQHRQDLHEGATADLKRAKGTIDEADSKIANLQTERDAIYTNLDLEIGALDELQALCDQVADYEDAQRAVEQCQTRAEDRGDTLEKLPGYESELKERDRSELTDEVAQAQNTADRYDTTQTEIAEIETKISEAKTDDGVESAISERERALDILEDQLEADYASMVGDVLVDHLQDATMEVGRPAVFERARDILATITYGRYRLAFDEDATVFRAYDERKQKSFALDELSSGTRVQVLLAIRIAFVDQQEQGHKLPFLLDETLGNADDHKAEVIIDAMLELARNGRQIFYFTAQGDEVAKWLAALEDVDTISHHVIDLSDVRDLKRTLQVPTIDEVATLTPDPPSPEGHDHASYGDALDVPPFNPHTSVDGAHLWYVVDDIEFLSQLLSLGIECWGQLKNLLERGNSALISADGAELAVVQQNVAGLEAFIDAWQIGHGDPVDRTVLEASGAVSNTFIDEVTKLAASVDGDAEAIIEALDTGAVDHFRNDKQQELEVYFREHGYIDPMEPLNDDEIRIRVIERLVEAGVARETSEERTTQLLSRVAAD